MFLPKAFIVLNIIDIIAFDDRIGDEIYQTR